MKPLAGYVVQVYAEGDWHAITKPAANRAAAHQLAGRLRATTAHDYRVWNRYTRAVSTGEVNS